MEDSKVKKPASYKDYKCKSCGKSFSQADDLRKHIPMVHEDHKDHKCKSCGKLFSQTGDLKKHINTIHMKTNVNLVLNHFQMNKI